MSTETIDLSFLSVIDLMCIKCNKKVSTFVCFCGQDVCLDCAISHQQGCKPAIDLTMTDDRKEPTKKRMIKKKRRR